MPDDVDRLHEERLKSFDRLVERVDRAMEHFGRPDSVSQPGDYSVLGDYWGYPQVRLSIHNLVLLRPSVIRRLQTAVSDFPGWEIVVVVAIRGHYHDWPDMALYVRPYEIFDTLQRQYFPKELQGIEYEGSRRGSEAEA